jgi:hypothetical protein
MEDKGIDGVCKLNKRGRTVGALTITAGGALLLITVPDWIANYPSIYELFSHAWRYMTPSPLFFGIFSLLLGVFTLKNHTVAAGMAYVLMTVDVLFTTVLFVGQDFHGIDIPLSSTTTGLLWVAPFAVMAGGIWAQVTDPRDRTIFAIVTLVFVTPLLGICLPLIFILTAIV